MKTVNKFMGIDGLRRCGPWFVLPLLLLLGCSMQEGVNNPLLQRFVWFDYLNGSDLRADCRAGSPPRYRLVYNARYQEQLRRYEVTGDGAGGAFVVARAQASGSLASIALDDVMAPWRWQRSETRLAPGGFAGFEAALERDGFFGPAPKGLRLPSAGFYWTAVGCRDGAVHFGAWRYPSAGYAALAFPALLFAEDRTGLPVNPPREIDAAELAFPRANVNFNNNTGTVFWLRVGAKGLAGF